MTTATNWSKEEAVQSVVRITEAAGLENIRMVHCIVHHNLRDGPVPTNVESGLGSETGINSDTNFVIHKITYQIIGRYDDTPPDTPNAQLPLVIVAQYEVVFRVDSIAAFEKKDIAAFAQYNGTYYSWPYWGEFVQSMTARLGLPVLTIPLFNWSDFDPDKQSK